MSLFLVSILFMLIFDTSKCEIVNCGTSNNPCTCINTAESCTLKCSGWQQCSPSMILNCINGQPCEVDCDSGDQSCENVIINANGATSLTVKCSEWRDCYAATINCGTVATCAVYCDTEGGPNHICTNLELNCGLSRCSITCSKNAHDDAATCDNINVDTSDPNIYSFDCFSTIQYPHACDDAPPQVLPPTQDPTNDPTFQPTTPTLSPSQAPTTPSANPSAAPSTNPSTAPTNNPSAAPSNNPSSAPTLFPTLPFEVITDITIEIEVDDPNISQEEIADLVDETTGAYLDTLFVESDYRLTVDVIGTEGDVLIVNIVVSTNGDKTDVDEKEIIDENKNGINQQYGDKVRIKSYEDEKSVDWYLYVIIGVVMVFIVAIVIFFYIKRKMKKRALENNDKLNIEIETPGVVNANDIKDNNDSNKARRNSDDDIFVDESDIPKHDVEIEWKNAHIFEKTPGGESDEIDTPGQVTEGETNDE